VVEESDERDAADRVADQGRQEETEKIITEARFSSRDRESRLDGAGDDLRHAFGTAARHGKHGPRQRPRGSVCSGDNPRTGPAG
jgi:hypothetical protein